MALTGEQQCPPGAGCACIRVRDTAELSNMVVYSETCA